MKVLLVNVPIWQETGFRSSYNPGMGLMYIGAVLREKGNDVTIWDCEALGVGIEEVIRELETVNYSHVGLSCLSNGVTSAIRMAREIRRRRPGVFIAVGGPGPSAEPEKFAEVSDSVCVGEGELIVDEVFSEKGIHVGVPVEDLDSLPMAAYDLMQPRIGSSAWSGNLPRPKLEVPVKETVVMWSRGCPHPCIFCSKASMKRGKPRLRGKKKIVEELNYLSKEFGINSVFVYDDELIGMSESHNEWLMGLCEEISKEFWDWGTYEHRISFKGQGRCSEKFINKTVTDTLLQAGFFAMMMGCESGSEDVKKRIKKGTTNDDIRHTLKILHETGLDVYGFWMVGMPSETEDDVRMTEKLIIETARYMKWLQVTIFSPLPGSDFWEEAVENKWFAEGYNSTVNFQVSGVLNMPWMDTNTISKWQKRLTNAYEWGKSNG